MQVIDGNGRLKVEVTNFIEEVTIGVTTITGGVSGRALYDNAGVLGELDLASIYVPLTRTLTINGTTQDLSANRTFTISTGITIGTTAITSGTVGRVLFEGTGNVVQESANLFWDNTNGRLGIGTSSPAFKADIIGTGRINNLTIGDGTYRGTSITFVSQSGGTEKKGIFFDGGAKAYYQQTTNLLAFDSPFNGGTLALSFDGNTNNVNFYNTSGTILSKIFANTGNWAINTTTDAGFKLDVNGTARVKGTGTTSATTAFTVQNSAGTTMLSVKDGGSEKVVTMASATIASIDISSTIIQVGTGNSIRFIASNGYAFNNTYATPDSSAIMDVSSTTKGFLPPRMTTTQKNAIASPASGLMVYDTTLNVISYYNGTTWI